MPWFDCAVHRPIYANTGGLLSPNIGLVLHHAVARGSLWSYFNNPSAQVSAHFWVSQTGLIEQYVDTGVVAWHGRDLNSRYVGVETEGCNVAPYAEPMSEEMTAALARLYAEGAARHGWANALANANGQPGFGYHRMAVNTACPCDVRLNMRPTILARAFGPPPQPEPEPPKPKPPAIGDSDVPLTDVIAWREGKQISFGQVSLGGLWHFWSQDNGQTWRGEAVMGKGNPSVDTFDPLVAVSAGLSDQGALFFVTETDKAQVWIARQTVASATWDRRRPGA